MADRSDSGDRLERSDRRDTKAGLKTYQKMSGTDRREDLVKKNLNLVSYVASRLAIGLPDWIDKRDLINAGVIGLIEAAESFDPSKGFKFETYSRARIRGAILDELRSLDWIPRSTRSKSREIERAIALLTSKMGRFPTDDEIAKELDWDMDKYYKTIGEVSVTTLLSLDDMVHVVSDGEPIKRIDTVASTPKSALDSIEKKELTDNVAKVISNLLEQERLVIALYYYEELTLKEIGMVMNVTESRISQIHTTAILKIRTKIHSIYFGS